LLHQRLHQVTLARECFHRRQLRLILPRGHGSPSQGVQGRSR
jgi:hypothetical protein